MKDRLIHFMFNNAPIHGAIVKLEDSYQEILNRHPYSSVVQHYLGQALAAVSLLSINLKEKGSIILQTQSDGPLSLLLAQVNHNHEIRGLAKSDGDISPNFSIAAGKGNLAITLVPQQYQGIINLKAENLSRVIENYFYQSEQLPTYLLLSADNSQSAGIFLQLMPQNNETDKDYWTHILYLLQTLMPAELLLLDNITLIDRLFNKEDIEILSTDNITFKCRCSREVMGKAIINLGLEDARKLLKERASSKIDVTCEFCQALTSFDSIDVENIFMQEAPYGKLS